MPTNAAISYNPNDSLDYTLKKFKKAVDRAGVRPDLSRHEAFVPRNQRRRAKSKAARKRRGRLKFEKAESW